MSRSAQEQAAQVALETRSSLALQQQQLAALERQVAAAQRQLDLSAGSGQRSQAQVEEAVEEAGRRLGALEAGQQVSGLMS